MFKGKFNDNMLPTLQPVCNLEYSSIVPTSGLLGMADLDSSNRNMNIEFVKKFDSKRIYLLYIIYSEDGLFCHNEVNNKIYCYYVICTEQTPIVNRWSRSRIENQK